MQSFRYPCTGATNIEGFSEFIARELGSSRANLGAFAEELRAVFGPRHLTLVNSGSSANLAAALAMAEETGGGEAIVAGFTFPTTLSSLLSAGYRVRVVDTEHMGFGMDPAALAAATSLSTRVICVTHFLGFPARLAELCAIAKTQRSLVLQDACETMDLRIDGAAAHEWGDLTTWSFYHPHHLSAFGGGAVLSPDTVWHQRVDSIVHWGRACTCHFDRARCTAPLGMHHNFHYVRLGHNLELSELNACFGRFALRTWVDQEARRVANYRLLFDTLNGLPAVDVFPPPVASGSPFVFPFALRERPVEDFAMAMAARGVEVRSLMGGAIIDQPAFANLPNDGLRNCRALARRACFVGIHQTIEVEAMAQMAVLLQEELMAR